MKHHPPEGITHIRPAITPYDDGWNARIIGKTEVDNPYDPTDPEWRGAWRFGWINANAQIEVTEMMR